MSTSPENPPPETLPLEDRIANLIDRIGNCIIKHVEYQVKRDTCLFLSEKTKIGLLLSIMLSSWLTVGLLMFIVFGPLLEPLLFPPRAKTELHQAAPPAERPYEIHHELEARTVA
jgi:hypothetical protein